MNCGDICADGLVAVEVAGCLCIALGSAMESEGIALA
jgi:hypothetical protein